MPDTGVGRVPLKIVSEGDAPPLKFRGGKNRREKIKKRKEKSRKVANVSIGSKQMGQNR